MPTEPSSISKTALSAKRHPTEKTLVKLRFAQKRNYAKKHPLYPQTLFRQNYTMFWKSILFKTLFFRHFWFFDQKDGNMRKHQ